MNELLSSCHLAPLVIDEYADVNEGPCSYCGEQSKAVGYWYEPDRQKVEVLIRRYKDGDCGYSQLAEELYSEINNARYQTIKAIKGALQPDKPMWVYYMPTKEWKRQPPQSQPNE